MEVGEVKVGFVLGWRRTRVWSWGRAWQGRAVCMLMLDVCNHGHCHGGDDTGF